MMLTLPNILTLSRVAVIPLFVGLFFLETATGQWIAWGVFTFAAITDFFDGYLARAYGQQSSFGQFLDPVADKLLVSSALLMATAFGQIGGLTILPAVVILCREILVSGLREFLAGLQIGVPVSTLAKWKTMIQMFAIGFLIVGDSGPDAIPSRLIGEFGLWAAAVLTLITGYDYLRASLHHLTGETNNAQVPDDGARDDS